MREYSVQISCRVLLNSFRATKLVLLSGTIFRALLARVEDVILMFGLGKPSLASMALMATACEFETFAIRPDGIGTPALRTFSLSV